MTATSAPDLSLGARANYRIRPSDISAILCHRKCDESEQFLVRWKTNSEPPVAPRAVCSWQTLAELSLSLHHVQNYLESPLCSPSISTGPPSRKRKSPGGVPVDPGRDTARDTIANGLLTPQTTSLSRASSVISVSSDGLTSEPVLAEPRIYNGVLQRKAGHLVAKGSTDPNVAQVNWQTLPTPRMIEQAKVSSVSNAERMIRTNFEQKLRKVRNVRLENSRDNSTPSLDFTFINEFVLREGVFRLPVETTEGCPLPCRPHMGHNIGCEYTKCCACLEYAAVDEMALKRQDEAWYDSYMLLKSRGIEGEYIDTKGMPKKFPYTKPDSEGRIRGTLQHFYRESRNPIYECNLNCNCGPLCKSRLVQKGRRVPLTIFKTLNRGWGVYCDEDLELGEFVDTYLGEVVTNEEADAREAAVGKDKASYLYSLDKFVEPGVLSAESCFVVDGQYMGGVTRFINHSCEPNCRQFTVSYNKHDTRIYDLAFFACEPIRAGTELTFDYMDKDEEEEEEAIRKRHAAAEDPDNKDRVACNCGSKKCRGYLWS